MMKKKLTDIEKQVTKDVPFENYKAVCEQIVRAEWGIRFLETIEAKELEGENLAKEGIVKFEQILRAKKAEKAFWEKILCP